MDESAVLTLVLEPDLASDLREQGVVGAHANVGTRVEAGAALADDDGARGADLAAEDLHAQALCVGITTVTTGTDAFFMCHDKNLTVSLSLLKPEQGSPAKARIASGRDALDADLGETLAMAVGALVGAAPVLLVDDHLLGAPVADHFCFHLGAINHGLTDLEARALVQQ
jgi:hypothetical protein